MTTYTICIIEANKMHYSLGATSPLCFMQLGRSGYIIEKKRLQWYGHVKRMPEERLPKLIMEWVPLERRKRGRPRKTWMEGVQAAMTTNIETDQWRNREEWRLVSGRR